MVEEGPTQTNDLPSVLQFPHDGLKLLHKAVPLPLPVGEEALQLRDLLLRVELDA